MDMSSFCSKLFDILNTSKQMQLLIERSAALFGNPIGMGFYDFTVLYVSSDMPDDSLNAAPGTMSFFDHPEVLADLEKVSKSDTPMFFPQKVNAYAHIISALRYDRERLTISKP